MFKEPQLFTLAEVPSDEGVVDPWSECPEVDDDLEERQRKEELAISRILCPWAGLLQDYATSTTMYEWFRLEPLDGRLQIVGCGQSFSGTVPEWAEHDSPSEQLETDLGGGAWAISDFAISEGLSPGQPFLVEFKEPRWYRSSYEYAEYDVDYHWQIVYKIPKRPEAALRSWERALAKIERHNQKSDRTQRYYDQLRLRLKKYWKLEKSHWSSSLTLSLKTKIPANPYVFCLASGSSEGDLKTAFWKLLKDFRRRYPNEPIDSVLRLSPAVRFNQWELLKAESL